MHINLTIGTKGSNLNVVNPIVPLAETVILGSVIFGNVVNPGSVASAKIKH